MRFCHGTDGVVAINPDAKFRGRSVHARVNVIFSHSRSDTAAIAGLPSTSVLHTETKKLCTPTADNTTAGAVVNTSELSSLQKSLMRRAEWPTVPFAFQLPSHLSSSVTMQV